MKLMLPALRPAEPNPHHQAMAAQTSELLSAIDALLALGPGPAHDREPLFDPGLVSGRAEPVNRSAGGVPRPGTPTH